jgi:hypothetical protein
MNKWGADWKCRNVEACNVDCTCTENFQSANSEFLIYKTAGISIAPGRPGMNVSKQLSQITHFESKEIVQIRHVTFVNIRFPIEIRVDNQFTSVD